MADKTELELWEELPGITGDDSIPYTNWHEYEVAVEEGKDFVPSIPTIKKMPGRKEYEFSVDSALDTIDLTFNGYIPSKDAIEFFNVIRLVLGEDPEVNSSLMHYFLVDLLFGNIERHQYPYSKEIQDNIRINSRKVAIIASRNSAKSTVITAFFPIYVAITGKVPNFGHLMFIVGFGDSQQAGAKVQANTIRDICEDSAFCKEYFEKMRFTDEECEFIRKGPEKVRKRAFMYKVKGAAGGSVRGIRYKTERPGMILFDDIIKNEADANSDVIMAKLQSMIYLDAENALGGAKGKVVIINTPFNKRDPVYTALESGVWTPVCLPICEKIYEGMPREEYRGAWEDMHSYDRVMERYEDSIGTDTLRGFNQELMLRIADEGSKLIKEGQIQWISRKLLEKQLENYNIYITTDFTASNSKKGDFSATFVWAVSSGGDWFLLDVSLKKLGIEEQYEPLFHMLSKWGSKYGRQVTVGVEIDGQQQINLHVLKKMMIEKNTYFTFARQLGQPFGSEGISRRRAGGKKHEQFMRVHPLFQGGKMFFCEELRDSPDMKELLEELGYITWEAIASTHDDGLDCQVAGSLVLMADGTHKAIEEIVLGDHVKTVSSTGQGYSKANTAIMTGKKVVTDYTLSNGDVLSMTDNHLVMTTDGYVFACDLLPSHNIIQDIEWKKVLLSTEENGSLIKMDDTAVPLELKGGSDSYHSLHTGRIQAYGAVLRCMYTTKTIIKQMTSSVISNYFPKLSIWENMILNSDNGAIVKKRLLKAKKHIARQTTHLSSYMKKYVQSVGSNGVLQQHTRSIVQRNVGLKTIQLVKRLRKNMQLKVYVQQNVKYVVEKLSHTVVKQKHVVVSAWLSTMSLIRKKFNLHASTVVISSQVEKVQLDSVDKRVQSEAVNSIQHIQSVQGYTAQPVCVSKITHPELSTVQKHVNLELDSEIVKYAIANIGDKYTTTNLLGKTNRREELTYNFEVEETNNYMMFSGIVLHNCISMLGQMEVLLPAKAAVSMHKTGSHLMWGFEDEDEEEISGYSGY